MSNNQNEAANKNEKNLISIKIAKALVSDPFLGKDKREYREIKLPNEDSNDKSPWSTFVVGANQVHLDKYSNGKLNYISMKPDSIITLKKNMVAGQDDTGKNIYETVETKISAADLKAKYDNMRSEYNKTNKAEKVNKQAEKASVLDQIDKNQKDLAAKQAEEPTAPYVEKEIDAHIRRSSRFLC